MRDHPILKEKEKQTNQARKDDAYQNIQKKNRFYMLQANKGANTEYRPR